MPHRLTTIRYPQPPLSPLAVDPDRSVLALPLATGLRTFDWSVALWLVVVRRRSLLLVVPV